MIVTSRLTIIGDIQRAADIINESGYYPYVAAQDLGSVEVYGVKTGGELVGCAMVIRQGSQAYLDYLCIQEKHYGQGYAVKLLDFIAQDMVAVGVRRVHACVNGTNEAAAKLSLRYHAKVGFPYLNVLVNLEEYHGK
jgi:L-amino acid N-acyltransferase YncA